MNVQSQPTNSARIGLRWGLWFWLPFILPALVFAAIAIHHARGVSTPLQIVVLAFAPLPVLLFCGRWWALRGANLSEWAFIVAAIAHGLALFLAIAAVLFVGLRLNGEMLPAISTSDLDSLIIGWAVGSLWILLLASVVVWRVRRAAQKTGRVAESIARVPQSGFRWIAGAILSGVVVPLVLSIPLIAMLRYDTHVHRAANALLQHQIVDQLNPAIADLKDLEGVKSNLLVRKQILDVIERSAPSVADALIVVGDLPPGAELMSLKTHGDRIVLDLRCSAGAEVAAQEVLTRNHFRDVRIASRRPDDTGTTERISIAATSAREDRP